MRLSSRPYVQDIQCYDTLGNPCEENAHSFPFSNLLPSLAEPIIILSPFQILASHLPLLAQTAKLLPRDQPHRRDTHHILQILFRQRHLLSHLARHLLLSRPRPLHIRQSDRVQAHGDLEDANDFRVVWCRGEGPKELSMTRLFHPN